MAIVIGGGNDYDQIFIHSCKEKSYSFLSTLFSNKQDSDKIPNDYSLKRKANDKSNQKYTSLIGKSFCGNLVQAKNPLAHNPPTHNKHVCIRNGTHVDIMMWSLF
jgi:hypothetical protein